MTADYNGWADAPEAEREAMDVQEDVAGRITPAIDAVAETYPATYWDLRPAA